MQLNLAARKLLVDSYVALRRGDTAPGSRVAYRMTVRQLEALIRLSEAIAKSHLETQVPTNLANLFFELDHLLYICMVLNNKSFYRYKQNMLLWL